jgi:hypothetical protein
MLLSALISCKKVVMFLSSLKKGIDLELSTKTAKTGFVSCSSVFLIVGFISSKINKKRLTVFNENNKILILALFFSL